MENNYYLCDNIDGNTWREFALSACYNVINLHYELIISYTKKRPLLF